MSPHRKRSLLLDALLFVMVLAWGANYSLIKLVLPALPPRAFNGTRLVIASAVYLLVVLVMGARGVRRSGPIDEEGADGAATAPRAEAAVPPAARDSVAARVLGVSRPTAREWGRIALTGLVGHFLYQVMFIEGVARTSAANAALLIGASPIIVSLAAALVGQDRLTRGHWAGLALSFTGVYLVVGRAPQLHGTALLGDALMLGAVLCWAFYTIATRPLLERHSPLFVTTMSMTVGTVLFLPYAARDLLALDWGAVPWWAWGGVALSALAALNLAYLIWYIAVQRLGSARTSVWSNVIPLVGMAFAWALLGERISWLQLSGAALILAGVITTRLVAKGRASDPPPEE